VIAFVIDYLSPAEQAKVLAISLDQKAVVDIANAAIRDRAEPWRWRASVAIRPVYVSRIHVVNIESVAHAAALKPVAQWVGCVVISIFNESIYA
jgi:hypothetical protein